MDGFRADFLERGLTPTISTLRRRGAFAPYMKPSFPSITFANHYTIVTGLTPPSHGIIANRFTDPVFNATFAPGKPTSFQRRFWGGEPIWKTIERQGQIAATYFWPGSEVKGLRPTHWFPFKQHLPLDIRVDQVLAWLDLPRDKRPRFITLYMQEPDEQGHDFGPDSPEENAALQHVDAAVRRLVLGLQQRALLSCVNLLLVADHGMTAAGPRKVIRLRDIVPDFPTRTSSVWNGVFARFNSKENTYDAAVALMSNLSCAHPALRVYHRHLAPARWGLGGQRRVEQVVLALRAGWQVDADGTYKSDLGDHGYDNYLSDMNALFIAHGPAFRRATEVEAFQNIELYNLMCAVTGVRPAPNQGTWGALHALLSRPPPLAAPQPATFSLPLADLPPTPPEQPASSSSALCSPAAAHSPLVAAVAAASSEGRPRLEARHTPWGAPALGRTALLLLQPSHLTAYSPALGLPLWTAYSIEHSEGGVREGGARQWAEDPRVGGGGRPLLCTAPHAAPPGWGWQPLFRPAPDIDGNSTAALATNAVPVAPSLAPLLATLQTALLRWSRAYRGLHVALGPLWDADGDTKADPLPEDRPASPPTHVWAVVTRCRRTHGPLAHCSPADLDTLAFILPQRVLASNCLSPEELLLEHSARVRDVEEAAGVGLFPALPPLHRARLLTRLHPELWGHQTWPNRLRSDLFGLRR